MPEAHFGDHQRLCHHDPELGGSEVGRGLLLSGGPALLVLDKDSKSFVGAGYSVKVALLKVEAALKVS